MTEASPDTAVFKQGALDLVKSGKEKLSERIRLIRFADRDGWPAALRYAGDDIALDEAEEKKMRKSKKDTDK